ncbi:MAG: hypothetical protein IJ619_08760 [Eubacterium sp.]|nr:hypothetical protein [Eubacterium sp.]
MEEEIKKLLLEECIHMFEEISSVEPDEFYGTPPKVLYIDFKMGNKKEVGGYIIEPEETYRYECGSLESVEVGSRNKTEPASGMYFPEGRASIGIDKETNNVGYISLFVGPRYGRGFRYEVVIEDVIRLEGKKLLWVS